MNIIHTKAKDSSQVTSHGYDTKTRTMEITFKNGSTYTYKNVTPEDYKSFYDSSSAGLHFHGFIRNKYTGVKKAV